MTREHDNRIDPAAVVHPAANVYRSTIGAHTKVAAFTEIGGATVGRRCKIQAFAFLCPGVTLEDDVFVGPHVCFTNDRHPRAVGPWNPEPIRVGRGASIGAGAILLPGIDIGAGAMIAAGSVVRSSVPEGHLFDGRGAGDHGEGARGDAGNGHARLTRWYARQEDVGLPMTFDEWRDRYDTLSYADQAAFHDAFFEKFPDQRHGTIDEARRFFRSLGPGRFTVLELGGWDGRIARTMLDEFPNIAHWRNHELSAKAIATGLQHPRYTAVVPDRFLWDLPDFPAADVFFSAHCIEHVRAAQLERLASQLSVATHVYIESPLPNSAIGLDWKGRWSTHILEIGWEQVEEIFARHGFAVTRRAPDVRTFTRRPPPADAPPLRL